MATLIITYNLKMSKMMQLCIEICDKRYKYDIFLLTESCVIKKPSEEILITRHKCKKRKIKAVDSAFVHYLVKEFNLSNVYRSGFLTFYANTVEYILKFILLPTERDLIDYGWNDRVYYMLRERCELDHALSWLTTLGGAFSSLGDEFVRCAEIAGKISISQLKLALRLGDPGIVTRCRLYFSLSLIQTHRYKAAKRIIYSEYRKAKSAIVIDDKLINMCKGIWSKLQYEYDLYRRNRKYQIKHG